MYRSDIRREISYINAVYLFIEMLEWIKNGMHFPELKRLFAATIWKNVGIKEQWYFCYALNKNFNHCVFCSEEIFCNRQMKTIRFTKKTNSNRSWPLLIPHFCFLPAFVFVSHILLWHIILAFVREEWEEIIFILDSTYRLSSHNILNCYKSWLAAKWCHEMNRKLQMFNSSSNLCRHER